jgi:hypothetical protein
LEDHARLVRLSRRSFPVGLDYARWNHRGQRNVLKSEVPEREMVNAQDKNRCGAARAPDVRAADGLRARLSFAASDPDPPAVGGRRKPEPGALSRRGA